MTSKYQQRGETVNYVNAGAAITAGSVVKMGNTIGVALVDIATGGTGAVAVEGVFSGMAKTTGTAWAVGGKLIWDVSASKFDTAAATPATGDVTGGAIVWEAAASGDTTGVIKLTPGNTTVT